MKQQKKRLILGSKSPRRQQLIKDMGFQFDSFTKDTPEDFPADIDPYTLPNFLATIKAADLLKDLNDPEAVLLTADTTVLLDGVIYNKPENAQEAFEMLSALSGSKHEVITGVCITANQRQYDLTEVTAVTFKVIDPEELWYYIKTFKPFDKAGSYGIQEWIGYTQVERIEGSYTNILGLPTALVYNKLKELLF